MAGAGSAAEQGDRASSEESSGCSFSRTDSKAWPEFMTAEEVAYVIGLKDVRTVLKMIRDGKLRATKFGNLYRVSKAAVMDLLA